MTRGRRRGAPDTRAEVLRSARVLFAEHGYTATSVRSIAARAGVDSALVHHYFGTKADLFMAVLAVPVDPRRLLEPVVVAGAQSAGAGIVRTLLGVWDDPELRAPFLAVFRSVLEPGGDVLLRDGFLVAVIRPVLVDLKVDHVDLRLALVASTVLGLLTARYLLAIEPLASMPDVEVVETYAPVLQRFLTDPGVVAGSGQQ